MRVARSPSASRFPSISPSLQRFATDLAALSIWPGSLVEMAIARTMTDEAMLTALSMLLEFVECAVCRFGGERDLIHRLVCVGQSEVRGLHGEACGNVHQREDVALQLDDGRDR